MRRTSLLFSYFGAVCSIFEPERAKERLAWTKTAALVDTIESHFKDANADQRRAFVQQFTNLDAAQSYDNNAWYSFSLVIIINIYIYIIYYFSNGFFIIIIVIINSTLGFILPSFSANLILYISCLPYVGKFVASYVSICVNIFVDVYSCTTIVGILFYALSHCKIKH